MRVVWIVLSLLVLAGATAAWNALTRVPSPDDAALQAAEAIALEGAAASASRGHAPQAGPAPTADPSVGASSAPPVPSPSAASTPAVAPDAAVAPERPGDAASLAAELLASASQRSAPKPGPGSPQSPPSAETKARGVPITDGLDARLGSATVAAGSLERLADGSIRADDRFTIRGSGTASDPYRITWELLASAAESYQPRLGQSSIPQRIAMLHGKHVRIEGFATFPVFSFDPTELLMMLNQWDGCCIGIPPTPYDAIEAKLAAAPKERRRQAAYFGSLQGKLEVEPYLVENWLVGLYVMKDARFTLDM